MRIVIDMQGSQSESRFRGIGRYTLSFAQAIARNRGDHEVFLALNGFFPDTIEPLRAAFDGLLPQENIRVWYAPGPVREMDSENFARREVAELVREAFLASLKPDVVHVSSLFEGYVDDAVTSIGRFDLDTLISVSLYDLIPLLNQDHYLRPNQSYSEYYLRKVDHLGKAAICLAISEFSRREGLTHLDVPEGRIINVSTAIEQCFQVVSVGSDSAARLRDKFGLTRPFVLYTGGADERKNLPNLLRAFAALPAHLRMKHQLLLAGKVSEGQLAHLKDQARMAGLKSDELSFTGYIADEELVQLYNLCELFVFPSWHEGFGLPALEAMACGAPVVGANSSSLPEVIGLQDALFDPHDVSAISGKMAQALEDRAFAAALRVHGLEQAKRFGWDKTARRAIEAFEMLAQARQCRVKAPRASGEKARLAFVSPLPPERTGIADYSAELLPALAEYYDIELVVAQERVDDPWGTGHGKVRDVTWLRDHADEVDRVLYQMGNSPFHQHMLPLMREVPGVVVLHDFYLSSLIAWLELHAGADNFWTEALYAAHGYSAVRDRCLDTEAAKLKYPVNLHVLQYAQGVIVHSEYSKELARKWYGECAASSWEVIPHLRSPAEEFDKALARKELGLSPEDFVVCSFGFLDPKKLNHRLLSAWFCSALAADKRCKLIFVGENEGGSYGASLMQTVGANKNGARVSVTGFAPLELFRKYLAAADLAVQLRTSSRGESSGTVLDCMNYGLPLIANANGSVAEIDEDAAWMLPDEFDESALVDALEYLWRDGERRLNLGLRAREIVRARHAPAICAYAYVQAIEKFYGQAATAAPALFHEIAACASSYGLNEAECFELANAISTSLPLLRPARRLLLDVSATCRADLKTGIERVVRALLLALIETLPRGYRVEPVYLSNECGEWKHFYARRYTLGLMDCQTETLDDDIVEPECGDVMLVLDVSGDLLVEAACDGLFANYKDLGVATYCMVYDLLPVELPEVFPSGADEIHQRWLRSVAGFDGAICISRTIAINLAVWLEQSGCTFQGRRPYHIGWCHLGADLANSAPSKGYPDNAQAVLQRVRARPSFLMVGTIEPRKGYLQAIEAFSQLWNEDIDVNLVIVGKEGWTALPDDMRRNIPETIERLRIHPKRGNHLFHLEGISDEYLEDLYAASTCLIAASYGEGFGLPLIEAAQHDLPILCRDIPVFREVAGDHALYFNGESPGDLAASIKVWLGLSASGQIPASKGMTWLTWKESAEDLVCFLQNASHAAMITIK